MARNRSLIALALLAGCGESEPTSRPVPPSTDTKVATSPQCAQKVAALAPWLEKLELEQASHEIDFGYELQVIDREPMPLPHKIDVVIVTEKKIVGWDLAGTAHEQVKLDAAPKQAVLEETLAAMFTTKPDPADKELPPPDLLRFDIDPKAAWTNVVRSVAAARKAGYTRAMFAFTATSKLEAPLGTKPKYSDHEDLSRANRRLEEIREKHCKEWDRALLRHTWNPDRAANARAVAKEAAEAIAACNCGADPDEVRVLEWIDAHWHQATIRTSVVVRLVGETPATPITFGLATPWSEAHAPLLAAAPEGAPPPVVELVGR